MVEEKVLAGGEAKFNMGLATLEEINNLLQFYHKISVMDHVKLGNNEFKLVDTLECQIIKSRLCNQLLLASRMLLKEEQKKEIVELLKTTQIKFHNMKLNNGAIVKRINYFSYDVDIACDNFIANLVDVLQVNKVFMPGKGESSLF